MYEKTFNENVCLYDVDQTLVTFKIIPGTQPIVIPRDDGNNAILYPIQENIEKLRESHLRGHYVRVHSAGGVKWAEEVVLALKIHNYVDSIETKPKWYCDDEPAEMWMRRFYGEKRV